MNRILVVLLVLACSPVAVAHASPVVRGSVEQVQVTGAKPGQKLVLKRHGDGVALQRAGSLGGAVFRRVEPGGGYRVAGKTRPRAPEPVGAAEHEGLRPEDPGERLRLPDAPATGRSSR